MQFDQHIAILRYLARRVGAYDGETSYEKYLVDAVSEHLQRLEGTHLWNSVRRA